MSPYLDDFLSRLGHTASVEETWGETLSFQKSLGFGLAMYGYAVGDPAKAEVEFAALSNFPENYQHRYRLDRYDRHDPVVAHCVARLTPQLVGREAVCCSAAMGRKLTLSQRRVIDEAADCGMQSGIVIPLRSPGRFPFAGLSLSNAMPLAEFRRFLAERGSMAQLAAMHAHTRIQMQLQPQKAERRAIDLTIRERDCLLWASRGLSSKETGDRMHLSSRTVEFHVANAMNKLNAASRIQAVACAMTLGLVTP